MWHIYEHLKKLRILWIDYYDIGINMLIMWYYCPTLLISNKLRDSCNNTICGGA